MRTVKTVSVGILAASAIFFAISAPARAAERPNIVFVIADDLGYGDLGCFGQKKFATPNLDRLAREGMRMTRMYSGNAVCAPSRCVLMTGLHPGHAFIRDNREHKPEGQYPIPPETVTLAERLKMLGYTNGGFGKWGLGFPGSTGEPLKQGFDRFFGYNCQAVAHNFYPTYLWNNDQKQPLRNPAFSAHQKLKPEDDRNDPKTYARFIGPDYAPDLIAEQALAFVDANKDRPFFLFYPTTVPHLALQVPDDSLAEYVGKFEEEPYDGSRGYLPHKTPRAAYAAEVTRMDREIGKLMKRVAELGLDEKTIFIFTSDNGPLYDKLGGTDCDFFNSNGGLRGRKGSLFEGGVRVPCIVRWPGKIKPGTESERRVGFEDWTPTILAMLGESPPQGLDGISFWPTLQGQTQSERPFLYREFPSYGGQVAVWLGNYKATRQNLGSIGATGAAAKKKRTAGSTALQLYDLSTDPTESKNIAGEHPEVVKEIEAIIRREHVPSQVFPLPALDIATK